MSRLKSIYRILQILWIFLLFCFKSNEHITMKIFQTFRDLVRFIFGQAKWNRSANSEFNASNPNQNYSYNLINLLPWLHLVLCFILCTNFVHFEAETLEDYADVVYALLTLSVNIFFGVTILLNRAKFLEFIFNFEKLIEKRKLKMNQKIW